VPIVALWSVVYNTLPIVYDTPRRPHPVARVPPSSSPVHRSRWSAALALAAGILCVAWSAIFVRWAGVSGPASAFYRTLIATAILLPWWLSRRPRAPLPPRAVLFAALGGAFFAFDIALYNSAILLTSASTATLLGTNAPIAVGLGAWLVFGERPRPAFWTGLALALLGSAIIVGGDAFGPATLAGAARWGNAMAIGSGVFFAGYLLTTQRVRVRMDTLTFTTLAVAASTLTLFLLCIAIRVPLAGYPPRAWLSLAGLGVISQVGGYLAIAYALGPLPATATSVGLLAQAPLTALLAVPLLGEPITRAQGVGGALVLAGIYVVNRRTIAARDASAGIAAATEAAPEATTP
jgi:drug/metabolite transporter (DMT)-like permease